MSGQGEPLDLYSLLMGEVGEVPVPRSFAETTGTAFRAQDLADAPERKRAEKQAAERQTAQQDMADLHAFMGRGRTHADVLGDFAELADRADKWQAHQAERAAKKAERERQEAQERRIAELEAEVATAATRSQRDGRALRTANEAAAAFRQRSEQGATFRGTDDGIWRGGYEEYREADGRFALRRR